MYAVSGASGRLGRLVLERLLQKTDASNVIALTRTPSKLQEFSDLGVDVREFDFNNPQNLTGISKLLLISGDEIGARVDQHRKAVDAAKEAGVKFIAYTSVLHADTCAIALASDHRETESYIRASGLEYAFLRHGWYIENIFETVGCSGQGRLSSACRADYAAGDADVLLNGLTGVFEFAGAAFTMDQYAEVLAEVTGTAAKYVDLSPAEYERHLLGKGLPPRVAAMLVDAGVQCSKDVMFDDSGQLQKVIGRPVKDLRSVLKEIHAT